MWYSLMVTLLLALCVRVFIEPVAVLNFESMAAVILIVDYGVLLAFIPIGLLALLELARTRRKDLTEPKWWAHRGVCQMCLSAYSLLVIYACLNVTAR